MKIFIKDPYCVVKLGLKQFVTQIKKGAGQTPVWN